MSSLNPDIVREFRLVGNDSNRGAAQEKATEGIKVGWVLKHNFGYERAYIKAMQAKIAGVDFRFANMCGDCANVYLTKFHDPSRDRRRICKLCGTDWHGIDPANRRREAIMEQKRRGSLSEEHKSLSLE